MKIPPIPQSFSAISLKVSSRLHEYFSLFCELVSSSFSLIIIFFFVCVCVCVCFHIKEQVLVEI